MNVQRYKNIILPLLAESFGDREAENLFKYTLEDYFKKRFLDVKDYSLNDDEIEELNYIYEKISNHYPIQYIFNKAHFYGLDFYVDEYVLIPRPETEELVHLVLNENKSDNLSLLDIGTGSGCIPIAIKKNKHEWKVYALDVSEKALVVAKKNAAANNVEIDFIQHDIISDTHDSRLTTYDLIVSNPPYIPYKEKDLMSTSTVQFEPELALFVEDSTPLVFYDKIADFALQHLSQDGKLYFELNEFYTNEVKQLLEDKGFVDVIIKKDLSDKDRMISANAPSLGTNSPSLRTQ